MRFLRFAFLPFCVFAIRNLCAGRSPAREFEKQGRPLSARRPLEGPPWEGAPWEGDAPAEPNCNATHGTTRLGSSLALPRQNFTDH